MNPQASFDASYLEFTRRMDALRRSFAQFASGTYALRSTIILLSITLFSLLSEAIFYFPPKVRFFLFFGTLSLAVFSVISDLFWFFAIRSNRISKYSNENLCRLAGKHFIEIRDRLLNGYQLIKEKDSLSQASFSLVQRAFVEIWREVKVLDFNKIIPWDNCRKEALKAGGISLLLFLFVIGFNDISRNAFMRLTHPHTEYSRPLPFSIESISGNLEITGGDDTKLKFVISGKVPPNLFLKIEKGPKSDLMPVEYSGADTVVYFLQDVKENLNYSLVSFNTGLIKLWKEISSPVHEIIVRDRPELTSINLKINYPDYTELPHEEQELTSTEIRALKGSILYFRIFASQPLKEGYFNFSDSVKIPLNIEDNTGNVSFRLLQRNKFHVSLINRSGISNSEPVEYQLIPERDEYPAISLISPSEEFDLDQEMNIPLHFRIRDDFGFSEVRISYRLQRGMDNKEAGEIHYRTIPNVKKDITAQEIYYSWDISDLGLFPRDEIQFSVQVYDNDNVSGPKMAESKVITARFPSLIDLFTDTDESQEVSMEETREALEDMQTVKDAIDEIALEMKKNPGLDWEQKKELEASVEKTRQAVEKLEKISDDLQQLMDQAEKNNLFSPEVMEKYMRLQETFRNIITPELREALEKLQKALESMDEREIQRALQDFQLNQEQFAQEIERLLELFRRVEIEQKTDALVKYLEDITSREDEILNRINDEEDLNSLSDQQDQIKEDVENLREMMQETAEMMDDFPLMPADSLKKILEQMEKMDIPSNLSGSSKAMQSGNREQAWQLSSMSQQDLQNLLDQMSAFQQYFQQQTVDEMSRRFRNVLNKALQLSQRQEALSREAATVSRQSPRVRDIAREQNRIRGNLSYLIEDLMNLSKETFAVTRDIGMSLGKASVKMGQAQNQLEGRNIPGARNSQRDATAALNETALSILQAMEAMQQSGSASGFQNYLQQMQQLSQKQMGVNQQSLNLGMGQPMDMAGKAALRRLAAQQRQIQKSLQNLQNEISGNPQQEAQLEGIAKDMEEVARDLENNSILRRTIERQQRILSRMLSAQKSMRRKDFEEKRKSKTAGDIARTPPGELPAGKGETHLSLEKNLEKALNDGYARDYETLIQKYFETLRSNIVNNENEKR